MTRISNGKLSVLGRTDRRERPRPDRARVAPARTSAGLLALVSLFGLVGGTGCAGRPVEGDHGSPSTPPDTLELSVTSEVAEPELTAGWGRLSRRACRGPSRPRGPHSLPTRTHRSQSRRRLPIPARPPRTHHRVRDPTRPGLSLFPALGPHTLEVDDRQSRHHVPVGIDRGGRGLPHPRSRPGHDRVADERAGTGRPPGRPAS